MLQCKRCGRRFEPKDTSASHLKRNPPQFCSRACGRTWRRNGERVPCTQCGRAIYRRKSHLALTRMPFCSFACYGRWQRTHLKEVRSDLREWRRRRLLALTRDGHRCQDCRRSGLRVVVHHIQEREKGRPDNHALDNLVTLCDSCHRIRHSKMEQVQ